MTAPILARRGAGLIGVDAGERWLCAAQVVGQGPQEPSYVRAGLRLPRQQPGPLSEEESGLLSDSLERAGFIGDEVVLGIPDKDLLTAVMELPPRTSKAPVDELARLELARLHRREAGTFEAALWDLPEPDRKGGVTHAMAVGLAHEACEESVDALERAGLRVMALEPRPCALARVCGAGGGHAPGLVGVVEVGWEASLAMLMHVGAGSSLVVVYERRLADLGLQRLFRSLAERLGLSPEASELVVFSGGDGVELDEHARDLVRAARAYQSEFLDALTPEVQRSLGYAVQRYGSLTLGQVLLTGEGGAARGLRERLSNAVGAEARVLTVRDVARVAGEGGLGRDGALLGAVGLSGHDRASARRLDRGIAA